MTSWLAAFGLLGAFVVLARAFGLAERSRKVFATTGESMAVMRTASMSDDGEGSGAAGERHRPVQVVPGAVSRPRRCRDAACRRAVARAIASGGCRSIACWRCRSRRHS